MPQVLACAYTPCPIPPSLAQATRRHSLDPVAMAAAAAAAAAAPFERQSTAPLPLTFTVPQLAEDAGLEATLGNHPPWCT